MACNKVGKKKDTVSTKPAKLTKYEPEVRIDRRWKAGVGDGLGRKYLRIRPALVADRIFAADGYGNHGPTLGMLGSPNTHPRRNPDRSR